MAITLTIYGPERDPDASPVISPVSLIAEAVRQAARIQPTKASVDQVIADVVSTLWPPQAPSSTTEKENSNAM